MWQFGFFLHEIAFGLLSVFIPLYVVSVSGSVVYVGITLAIAVLSAIPASFFWGYVCDKTQHYRRFILLSFLSLSLTLYLLSITSSIELLITLYALAAVFHEAGETPKNVLIAELYTHEEWRKAYAFYEAFTEAGWVIGLVLGVAISPLEFGAKATFLLCSALNLAAFFVSLFLVADPLITFERGLVNMEKIVSFTYRGANIASKLLEGIQVDEKLRRENVCAFCAGLVLFSLATSMLFAPMPIFFSKIFGLAANMIFVIYFLNSLGGFFGYVLAWKRTAETEKSISIYKIAFFRGALTILLLLSLQLPFCGAALATAVLAFMGFAYALFIINTLSISMEIIPQGKAGLFNALVGLGNACGSFTGPYMAQMIGFSPMFLTAGTFFFLACLSFKIAV